MAFAGLPINPGSLLNVLVAAVNVNHQRGLGGSFFLPSWRLFFFQAHQLGPDLVVAHVGRAARTPPRRHPRGIMGSRSKAVAGVSSSMSSVQRVAQRQADLAWFFANSNFLASSGVTSRVAACCTGRGWRGSLG